MRNDLIWYYEQMTMTGTWSPVICASKPDYAVKNGVAHERSNSGPGRRIRAIQEIPEALRGLTLRAIQSELTTDAIEVTA